VTLALHGDSQVSARLARFGVCWAPRSMCLYEVLMELTQRCHGVAGFSRCQPRFERLGDFRLNACAEDARRASDDARESRYNADKLYSKAKEAVVSDVDGEP
jgi:hypothetical protein